MEIAANSDHKPAGKNLVIGCDRTGNDSRRTSSTS